MSRARPSCRSAPTSPKGCRANRPTFPGRVLTPEGKPIAGATLDLWSTDGEGWYDVQLQGQSLRARGKIKTDAQGRYAFWTIKPVSYPIPTDGPVGKMLQRMVAPPLPAGAHAHDPVRAGLRDGRPRTCSSKAIRTWSRMRCSPSRTRWSQQFKRHEPGTAPDGKRVDRPYYTVQYDFGLVPSKQAALQ